MTFAKTPFVLPNAPLITCVFMIDEASSIKTGINLKTISTSKIKYLTGILIILKGNSKMFNPSIKSYSGVETKKAEMHPSAEYVRKIEAKQNKSLDLVIKNHLKLIYAFSPSRGAFKIN